MLIDRTDAPKLSGMLSSGQAIDPRRELLPDTANNLIERGFLVPKQGTKKMYRLTPLGKQFLIHYLYREDDH